MLNKQGNTIQPWCTPFPIWNQSLVPGPLLTVASWPAYRFLKGQIRWSGIPMSLRIFNSLLWSTIIGFGLVNKAEVDVFLELSCFFNDSKYDGNLVSVSSTYLYPAWTSGSSWFMYSWSLVWGNLSIALLACRWVHFYSSLNILALSFFEIGMKTDLLYSCGHCWVFQICWHIECSTFIASSFRISNSSTGFHHLH